MLPNATFDDGTQQPRTFASIQDAPDNPTPPQVGEPPRVTNATDAEKADAVADSPAVSEDEDFEFVRLPNGQVRAVPKASIQDVPATDKSDSPVRSSEPIPETQYYVWLANGDVKRVSESDMPAGAGTNAQFGHWQVGDKVHTVVGVYPVEDTVKGA